MAGKEMAMIYDLVFSAPRIREEIKLTITVSSKNLLMLCLLVENGIHPVKEKSEQLAELLSKETVAELGGLIPEILKKGGSDLFDFYEKLKRF
jgi:hypothetical protein